MSSLILLSIGLIALTGALCALTYARVSGMESTVSRTHDQLQRLEVLMHELEQTELRIQSRIDQLSVDVLHREIYREPQDRHQLAIKAASEGADLSELMQDHGLSADEALLVISLHGHTDDTQAISLRAPGVAG